MVSMKEGYMVFGKHTHMHRERELSWRARQGFLEGVNTDKERKQNKTDFNWKWRKQRDWTFIQME